MGVKDTDTAIYMQQNDIFADAFNFYMYNGKQIIDPNSLVELDTREMGVPYGGAKGAKQPIQKIRDVIKSVTAKKTKNTAFLILAIENQSNIHYAMPVKNMVYDALNYSRQVEEAEYSHKQSEDFKNVSSDEFLSGFLKKDKLIPVVTLVVYFGLHKWDGPMSIHEMFEYKNEEVLAFVPDYKLNLISPEALNDNDFDKFNSSLKQVLTFIKYSKNADKLKCILSADNAFKHLGRKEVNVLNSCADAKLHMAKNEEVLDVCQAIQILNQRAADERQIEVLTQSIKNLMKTTGVSVEQAMDNLIVSEHDRVALKPHFHEFLKINQQ